MLNLDLIKPLPQPNWALAPFLGRPPTIAEYKSNKAKYQSEIIEAGVYRIIVAKFAVHAWGDDLLLRKDPDYWAWRQLSIKEREELSTPMPWKSDMHMIVRTSNYAWTKSLEAETIRYENGIYIFTGVFEKSGSVVYFDTLHQEAIACV